MRNYNSNLNLQMRKLTKTNVNLTPPPAHPFHHSHFKKPSPATQEISATITLSTLGNKTVAAGFRLATGSAGYTVNP